MPHSVIIHNAYLYHKGHFLEHSFSCQTITLCHLTRLAICLRLEEDKELCVPSKCYYTGLLDELVGGISGYIWVYWSVMISAIVGYVVDSVVVVNAIGY